MYFLKVKTEYVYSIFLFISVEYVTDYINSDSICPPGSELVAGICKCNQDLCEPPPCDKFLNIVRNGTDNPTSCCPIYTCDDCTSDSVGNGSCSCGEEAFLNVKGECECIDPHKSFEDNICVCKEERCELPILCDLRSVPIREKVGCCFKTTCKRCPDDMYPTNFLSDEIENKCVCYPCPKTYCNETHVPDVLRKGTNLANQCCDLYQCVPKMCIFDNVTYTDGERWISKENQNCSCSNGVTLCDEPVSSVKKSCLYNNVAYPHLASWTMDTCTNCTCDDGNQKCIAHLCNITEDRITKYNECAYQDQLYKHSETWQSKDCGNCTCDNGTPKCELHMCDSAPIDMKKPNNCPSLEKCKRYCKYGFKNRKGCEICKCKLPEKIIENSPLDAYMRNHNLSENDVLDLLNEKTTTEQCKGKVISIISIN